jgi:hypothetical protein
MTSVELVAASAVSLGASHAFLFRRLIRRSLVTHGFRGFFVYALILRLLPAAALVAVVRPGDAASILVSLAGLWVGRTAVILGVRVGGF